MVLPRRRLLSAACFVALAVCARAETLESVLRQMDSAAAAFQSLTAHVRSVKHTAIVNDDTVDEGTMWVKRVRPRVSRMLIEFTVPDKYYVAISEKKAEVYRPKIATIEEYDVAKFRDLKDQLFLLSFGAAGRDLAAAYKVSLKASETVAGSPAAKLELIPKSDKLLQQVPKIEMWVSTAIWQPVQQKVYDVTPGDYRLSTYTDVNLNVPVSEDQLKIHPARGTRRIQPQKQ